ncbi:MAG: hypothetical protein AAGD25_20345 [Cyanobacteria bacterium P01_F01_bin.150]
MEPQNPTSEPVFDETPDDEMVDYSSDLEEGRSLPMVQAPPMRSPARRLPRTVSQPQYPQRGYAQKRQLQQRGAQQGHLQPSSRSAITPMTASESVYADEWDDEMMQMPLMNQRFVYALGTVSARFPNMSLEKEFAQAASTETTTDLTDRQIFYQVLSNSDNRYIARDMCWIFTVENVETYILKPRTTDELTQLIDMLNEPVTTPMQDVDVVIGRLGPIAPYEMCNGLQLPIVLVNQTYSFQVSEFISQISQPSGMETQTFQTLATETFTLLMQLADNVGNLDEHRAVNYLTLRYQDIYNFTLEQYQSNIALYKIDVQLSPLSASGTRAIVEVIFTYRDRSNDIKTEYYVAVDVSGMFPFLVSQLQPYYERPSFPSS